MARIGGKITEQTVLDMKRAATRLIALHGFEGMNLRMLADEIGVKAGSFYNHIEAKEALLHTLLADTMVELMAMLSGMCTWYRADGRLGVKPLVRQYTRMALGAAGARRVQAPSTAARRH
jgi:hypothetical protein